MRQGALSHPLKEEEGGGGGGVGRQVFELMEDPKLENKSTNQIQRFHSLKKQNKNRIHFTAVRMRERLLPPEGQRS